MLIIMDKFLTDFKGDAICNHETYKGILLRDGDYDVFNRNHYETETFNEPKKEYCKNKDIHTTIRVIHGKFASNTKERISHILKEEDQNVIGLRVSNIGCDSCELEIDWESYNNFRTYNGEVY